MTHPMMAGGAVLLLTWAMVPQARAVELSDPAAIRACLCLDQAVTSLSATLAEAKESYDARRKALADLESRATAARQRIDPADPAQRDELVRLLDARDAARSRFADETAPQYNTIVARYNQAAEAFNQQCDDKTYDWSIMQQVQSSLSCPGTPGGQSALPRDIALSKRPGRGRS